MSDEIIQLNTELIHTELKDLVKNSVDGGDSDGSRQEEENQSLQLVKKLLFWGRYIVY